MANFTAIENNPIFIDLTIAALTTGWTSNGSSASHESCNAGKLYLLDYPLTIGQMYRYTYQVNAITSGYVQTNFGARITTTGLVDETFTANDTQLYFYANGNCTISNFAIEVAPSAVSDYQQNTIAFNEKLNKWTSFYTYLPESVFSIFTKSFPAKDGQFYVQEANTSDRCRFFGQQFPATIFFTTNQQPSISKTFESLNYQANQLLITPASGINTANGGVSELIPTDFLQEVLADNISPSVFIYDAEGIYKASFMRAFPDLVEGNILQGNWMNIGLQTTEPNEVLVLFTTEVEYVHSRQNIR